jgi:hypothetical protein
MTYIYFYLFLFIFVYFVYFCLFWLKKEIYKTYKQIEEKRFNKLRKPSY